ncbi:MAG: molybdopterin-dependent oxidoreductase [Firmicutes bacterium]|nr:molybdopterin-dependent oxidoreductase [Bacillota bacterium]
MSKISRRDFLKSAGVVTAGLLLSPSLSLEAFAKDPTGGTEIEGKWVHSACSMCTTCPAKFKVVDGKIVDVAGEDIPLQEGRVCAKALSGIQGRVYAPDRIYHPLKRVGKRGEGKFIRCSWDEVINDTARYLKKYQDEGHPERFSIWWSCPAQTDNPQYLGYWTRIMGTEISYVHGQSCFGEHVVEGKVTYGKNHAETWVIQVIDWARTKYALVTAMNLPACGSGNTTFGAGGNATPFMAPLIVHARRNGMKMINVDPRLADSAASNEGWLPIKPGTDGALCLGICNVLIKEGLYNSEFLLKYTNAPQLINAATLEAVKDEKGNYLVWDNSTQSAVPMPRAGYAQGITLGLGKTYTVDGVVCKTAFQVFAEEAAKYTPEKTVEITEIPFGPEKIEEIALEMAEAAPAAIHTPGFTAGRYSNWFQLIRCSSALNMLLGSFGVPGGWYYFKNDIAIHTLGGGWPEPGVDVPEYPEGSEWVKGPWGTKRPAAGIDEDPAYRNPRRFHAGVQSLPWYQIDAIESGRIRTVISTAENPAYYLTNIRRVTNAFKKLDLLIVGDQVPKDSMDWADYVIPECSYVERAMLYAGTLPALDSEMSIVFARSKVLEPLGESQPVTWFLNEVAKKVDPDRYKKYFSFAENKDWEHEWNNRRLHSSGLPPVSKQLSEKGPLVLKRKLNYDILRKPIMTRSGRFELYANELAEECYFNPKSEWYQMDHVFPIPLYIPIAAPTANNEFYLSNGKPAWHQRNATQNNRILMEDSIEGCMPFEPIYINAAKAAELGIRDGDWVTVEFVGPTKQSDPCVYKEVPKGTKDVVPARVTETIHPSTCFTHFGAGHRSKSMIEKARIGLPHGHFLPDSISPYAGGIGKNYAIVKVRKATPEEVSIKEHYIKTGDFNDILKLYGTSEI